MCGASRVVKKHFLHKLATNLDPYKFKSILKENNFGLAGESWTSDSLISGKMLSTFLELNNLILPSWLERPTGIWEAMGSIPVGDSEFFFVPCSSHVENLNKTDCALRGSSVFSPTEKNQVSTENRRETHVDHVDMSCKYLQEYNSVTFKHAQQIF